MRSSIQGVRGYKTPCTRQLLCGLDKTPIQARKQLNSNTVAIRCTAEGSFDLFLPAVPLAGFTAAESWPVSGVYEDKNRETYEYRVPLFIPRKLPGIFGYFFSVQSATL